MNGPHKILALFIGTDSTFQWENQDAYILFIGFHTETGEHHPTFAEGLPARNRCKSALQNYWLGFKIV